MKTTTEQFYNLTVDKTAAQLKTDRVQGLTAAEAAKRLAGQGYNEFTRKTKKSIARKFAEQFKSFMIIVLMIAAVISGIVGWSSGEGITDAIIIILIVILNAVIGVIQEVKAEKSLEALEKLSAPFSRVIRDGYVVTVPSREVVRGDVVAIETGDLVPADMRLTETMNLKIQEASLTGESMPVDKNTYPVEGEVTVGDRTDMAYSSTIVAYGRGYGIVVETGMMTEVGKIAGMIQSVPETKTPLQKKIDQLGKYLGTGALAICAVIFTMGLIQGRELFEMFMTAVSLAVAAIPEGLPAVSTVVLAVGVQRLAKKHAIIRHLPSVETLGSTSVICSDKTGTLTQNKMTIVRLFTDNANVEIPDRPTPAQELLLRATTLANDAKLNDSGEKHIITGDPTEAAFIDLALHMGMNKNEMERRYERIAEIPFDSDRKLMTTVNGDGKELTVYTKGGLDEVLEVSAHILLDGRVVPLTEKQKIEIRRTNVEMAGLALRVLGGAYKNIDVLPPEITPGTLENGLVFIGMAGMIDPPRREVRAAVEKCRTAGIKPVMITGDHLITATAIAESLEIKEGNEIVVTGYELEKMSDGELMEKVGITSVYARVSPEHKMRIIRAFQHSGYVVAMTGDGVNDAPALKLADIGVAMGITGTDVSKEAADVVLTDDNFATIVEAVEEGRRIYDNIIKAIQFLLSTNIGEVIVIFVAIMLNLPAPLLPIQILWVNLVTDSLPALALSVDPAEPDVMLRKPIPAGQSLLDRPFFVRIVLQGIMIGGLSLAAFFIGMERDLDTAHTMTFAVLVFSQVLHALNVRSLHYSAFRNIFSNKMLLGALAIVLIMMFVVLEIPYLQRIFHVIPLPASYWLWVAGLSLAPLPIIELLKGVTRYFSGHRKK